MIEQEERNEPLSFKIIQKAIVDLYDTYDKLPEDSRAFIEALYKKKIYTNFISNVESCKGKTTIRYDKR